MNALCLPNDSPNKTNLLLYKNQKQKLLLLYCQRQPFFFTNISVKEEAKDTCSGLPLKRATYVLKTLNALSLTNEGFPYPSISTVRQQFVAACRTTWHTQKHHRILLCIIEIQL